MKQMLYTAMGDPERSACMSASIHLPRTRFQHEHPLKRIPAGFRTHVPLLPVIGQVPMEVCDDGR